jgi:uncharacterized FlaG/YvyC family protein
MNIKVNQSQTQKINPPKSGMEIFLAPSSNQSQKSNPNPAQSAQKEQHKEEVKEIKDQPQIEKTKPKLQFEEVEETIRKIAKEIEKTAKEVEFSRFNEIVYSKKLQFKLLMITTKIYILVRDPNSDKRAVITVIPPKWGGSGLRYLISTCSENWCLVIERQTSKGKVLTYKALTTQQDVPSEDIDDIFD